MWQHPAACRPCPCLAPPVHRPALNLPQLATAYVHQHPSDFVQTPCPPSESVGKNKPLATTAHPPRHNFVHRRTCGARSRQRRAEGATADSRVAIQVANRLGVIGQRIAHGL